jgi:hypothetical protein
MKKNHAPFYILVLFIVLSNIPFLYALQGSARVDPNLGPGEITVDDKLNFALNDGVYVRNLRTGEGTRAIVGNRIYDSSIQARLSREIAGKIGISEAEGGIIELLSLREAIAQGFIDSDAGEAIGRGAIGSDGLELSQDPATLPTKAANTGGSPRTESNPSDDTPNTLTNAPTQERSAEVLPETPNPPVVASSSPEETPVNPDPGDKATPETTLPGSPIFVKPDESLAIRDAPAERIAEEGDTEIPQISLLDPSPAGSAVSDGESVLIKEEPVLEKALVSPETNLPDLPDRNPILSQGDESPTIREEPGLIAIVMAPEITLPAENLWNTSEGGEPRIREEPYVNTNLSQGSPWSYPEITLPAERLWDTRESEAPRISDTPNVNEANLSQKSPRIYHTDEYDIALVPAEKRPPAERERVTMPPEAEIPPIPNTPSKSVMSGLPPEREIPPIANAPRGRDGSKNLDPTLAIAPVEKVQPPSPTPSPAVAARSPFSVPLITTLEKGKYYVQLATFSKSELVEPELSKIGRSYPLSIQTIGSQDHPLYRILLGPMNLGESGALLQRFKGIGYTDAFVRQGG